MPAMPLEMALTASWPPQAWADVTVVIAVSGGADSVAAARALSAIGVAGEGRLVLAHLNHGIRAAEADADEHFVRKLADQLQLECRCDRLDPDHLAATASDGLEAAARDARYRFLRETAEQIGARYVVTAHTADDQVETILHRIVRGTGIGGLSGMPRARRLSTAVTLIRPMLGIHRSDVIEYLAQVDQPFREDASNQDSKFTRNRIRNELLPLLTEQYNWAADEALLRLGQLAGEAQSVIDTLVKQRLEAAVQFADDRVAIRRAEMRDAPPYIACELLMAVWQHQAWPLQAMGYDQWQSLAQMLLAAEPAVSTKQIFPGRVAAETTEEGLQLTRLCP